MDRMRRSPWQKWSGTTGSPVNVTSGANTVGLYPRNLPMVYRLLVGFVALYKEPAGTTR